MVSLINFSDINSSNRLDAEYYQHHLNRKQNLKKYLKLIEVCEFIHTGPSGSMLSASNYVERGMKVIRPSNLDGWNCDRGDFVYIPDDYCRKKKVKLYRKGDILISRVGDVKFGIVENEECAISPNLIAVRIKQDKLDPYYLLAFLNSKPGFDQIMRGAKRVSLASIDTVHLANLQLPNLSVKEQKVIGDIVRNALEKKRKAEKLYLQAEEMLMRAINFHINETTELSAIVDLSIIQNTKRADPEFYINTSSHLDPLLTGEGMQSVINQINFVELGETSQILRGIEPGRKAYRSSSKLFLRASNISKFGLLPKSQKYIYEKLFNKLRKKYQPQAGEILLVKDGKPGTALAVNEMINGIISESTVRLKINDKFTKEYLSLSINSPFCRQQIKSNLDGTLVPHWKVEQIRKLKIPIVDKSIRVEITNLVRKSHFLFMDAEKELKCLS